MGHQLEVVGHQHTKRALEGHPPGHFCFVLFRTLGHQYLSSDAPIGPVNSPDLNPVEHQWDVQEQVPSLEAQP